MSNDPTALLNEVSSETGTAPNIPNSEKDNVLSLVAWSYVWSPISDKSDYSCAWQALNLPELNASLEAECIRHFHVGLPAPTIPLYVSMALNKAPDAIRETVMRVMSHLGLTYTERVIPADHIAIICEVMAVALQYDEVFLAKELAESYLLPWCSRAETVLSEKHIETVFLVTRFKNKILEITSQQ